MGLQALFTSSEEAPEERGLGIFDGRVRRFQGDMRIPHMGWDQVGAPCAIRACCAGTGDKPYVYFAHSYYVPGGPGDRRDLRLHRCPTRRCWNTTISAACSFIRKNRAPSGLRIVRNFVEN